MDFFLKSRVKPSEEGMGPGINHASKCLLPTLQCSRASALDGTEKRRL